MWSGVVVLAAALCACHAMRLPRGPSRIERPENHPGVENCTVYWFDQVGSYLELVFEIKIIYCFACHST